jgi:Icc-related predicted phosphoesterase
MRTRILHTSDLHLHTSDHVDRLVERLGRNDFDVWCDTGDLLPDMPYYLSDEAAGQRDWYHTMRLRERITKVLQGRPGLLAPGNHDAAMLATFGEIPDGFAVNYFGFVSPDLAHFRRYNHRVQSTRGGIAYTLNQQLDAIQTETKVLLTHAPPRGCPAAQECEYSDYGCYDLPEVLRPGLTVLCGHVHKPLARDCDYRGARIINSARRNTVFTVDL